jgi:hypothetical protein
MTSPASHPRDPLHGITLESELILHQTEDNRTRSEVRQGGAVK